MAKMRQHTGLAETQEDRDRDKERTRTADKFEDMVKDRHWSEKGRDLMTERDWRIFREDFNIAYRQAGCRDVRDEPNSGNCCTVWSRQ